MSQKEHRQPPAFIHSALRDHNSLALPSVIRRASGIIIMGRRMKSLIFTTDIAIIRNCNADAVQAGDVLTIQLAHGTISVQVLAQEEET